MLTSRFFLVAVPLCGALRAQQSDYLAGHEDASEEGNKWSPRKIFKKKDKDATPNGLVLDEDVDTGHHRRRGVADFRDPAKDPCPDDLPEEFNALVERAKGVPYRIPSTFNRIEALCYDEASVNEVIEFAKETRPIVHPRFWQLADEFLAVKKEQGSDIEKTLYADMDAKGLVVRLLTKRPLMFMEAGDRYLLPDNTTGYGAMPDEEGNWPEANFDYIGTADEKAPLVLESYISYDEMALAAVVGMSTPTHFINDGGRKNMCRRGSASSRESSGIIIGQIGSRFERQYFMEWKHMIVTEDQNTEEYGYGPDGAKADPLLKAWAKFYGLDHFPLFEEAKNATVTPADATENATENATAPDDTRFICKTEKLYENNCFDQQVFKARSDVMAETYLAEADERAERKGAMAFGHLVGLGLGVWRVDSSQKKIQAQSYVTAITQMSLPNIAEIHFSYFGTCYLSGDTCETGYATSKAGNQIKVIFDKRRPSAKLPEPAEGEKPFLLVANYAWDGNSYPGNEYWMGEAFYDASGDPAAACSSYIPELQNPDINTDAFSTDRIHTVPKAEVEA